MDGLVIILTLIYLALGIYLLGCWMIITHKAGYSYWLGLLLLIPIANLVVFGILAFQKWPILAAVEKPARLCLKCNKHYSSDAGSFCSVCGSELVPCQKECPNCSYLAEINMSYCPDCGTTLSAGTDCDCPSTPENIESSPFDGEEDLETSGKNPLNFIIIIVLAFVVISAIVIVMAVK